MELLLTYTKIAHGRRIFGAATDEVKKRISLADMDAGLVTFRANGDKREERTEIFGLYT
jgi:hypothetical protein